MSLKTQGQENSRKGRIWHFKYLCDNFHNHLNDQLQSWNFLREGDKALFCKIDTSSAPRVTVSVRICRNLSLRVFVFNSSLDEAFLERFLGPTKVLRTWSQLRGLLEFFGGEDFDALGNNLDFYLSEALKSLHRCLENVAVKDLKLMEKKLKFLINQVGLLGSGPYSMFTVETAFSIYLCSSHCYREMQRMGCLSLPSESELLELIEKFDFGDQVMS